jgi:predicted aspartyl protease
VLIDPSAARRCEDDGPAGGLAFVVPAEIAREKVRLLLDTGAQRSDLLATSEAAKKLASENAVPSDPLFGAAGRIEGRQLRGVAVRAGGVATTATVNLVQGVADPSCPRDGVLGMDLLRRCALVFGSTAPRRVYGRCD